MGDSNVPSFPIYLVPSSNTRIVAGIEFLSGAWVIEIFANISGVMVPDFWFVEPYDWKRLDL